MNRLVMGRSLKCQKNYNNLIASDPLKKKMMQQAAIWKKKLLMN